MENLEKKLPRVKLYIDEFHIGAQVDDSVAEGLPIVLMKLNEIVGLEPDEKMNLSESNVKMQSMIERIRNGDGDTIYPILVRVYNGGYQIIDGHHRYHAFKATGAETIRVKIIPDEEIEIIDNRKHQTSSFA